MSIETFISTYGYFAIMIGTFFEGETILVLGGLAAHRGYLALPLVMFCGFFGTLCGDQFYFYAGRIKGMTFLEKRPRWKSKSDRMLNLIHKHQYLIVLGFRFMYGLRTLSPFLLGAIGFSPLRFLILNMLGAISWAVFVTGLGYLFGQVFELLLGKIKRYEMWLFLALFVIAVSVWVFRWFRRPKVVRNSNDPQK